MLTKYYLISDATNGLWYIEDSIIDMRDRWTPNITDAFRFATYDIALNELDIDNFPFTEFRIVEIIIKT